MPYRPRYLSVSAVECYVRCPAAYYRRYVDRQPTPPTAPMAFGRAFADALEALHKGGDGDLAWVRAYCREVQPLVVAGQPAPTLRHGLALLALYRQRGVAVGTPEWRFEEYLPDRDRVPVPIVGYLDVLGAEEVVEIKTSARKWDQGRVNESWQAAVYRWAFTRALGRKPAHVRFLVFHTRRVALEEFVTYPSGSELRVFEERAAYTWRGIVAADWTPRCGECPACIEAGAARGVAAKPFELELT